MHFYAELRANYLVLTELTKYKAAPKDPVFIKGQIPPDSLVVSNARKRANSLTGEAPPPDKESKLIDASGKRVASQAANSWRIANTQALLARYDRAHYDELEKLMTHLPKDHQQRADQLIQEGKIITNTSIKCSLDAADTAARSINTSIRHAWLRVSGFKQEVQTSLLNQPFDGKAVFGSSTDEALEKMKKDTETAKSMGALQQPSQRGSFRRSTYRGGSKNTAGGLRVTFTESIEKPRKNYLLGWHESGFRIVDHKAQALMKVDRRLELKCLGIRALGQHKDAIQINNKSHSGRPQSLLLAREPW
ncbi:uncharacterized protein LOC144766954 [Lissotriton helveticus]